tara:strand:+ start:200 stop:634 length:435 start_codon:yes stop_codon:yes gene_type:complete
MTASELKDKIKRLAKIAYQDKTKSDDAAVAYDELVKFPELKAVIVDLLTADFNSFLESVDWVSPRPSTFRINLLNGQNFKLTFDPRSWIAQVEGKKYYLLNLDEEEMAAKAVSRILAYGPASGATVEGDNDTVETEEEIEVDEE